MSAYQNTDKEDSLAAGAAAPDLALTNDQGQTVCLGDLWRQQPLVLLFVRHFG